MPTIKITDSYKKKAINFFQLRPQLIKKYAKTLFLLQSNPFHKSLRLHKLKGFKDEFYSISIDMKYRVILEFIVVDDVIILLDIGTHDEVY
jgi:mRNA-degrading endonuclease YafQ of YafQ-DinJ toxin-antitoxin module